MFDSLRQTSGVAAALLGLASLAGCGPQSAGAAERDGTRKCPSAWLGAQLPAGASVELLVAAGPTIPAGRWRAYRAMATAVAGCAGPGTAITLRPITDRSLTELPLFTGTIPVETGQNAVNPLRYRTALLGFAAREAAAVDRLPAVGAGASGSDPLGALTAAGQDHSVAPTGSKHVVVAIFNGWQQTRALNVFSYQRDPAGSTGAAVRALRASGALPELGGTDVVIVGLTAGATAMQTSDTQLAGLCRFWRGVVAASGGKLTLCAAALPGIEDAGSNV
jgi:hypothetical protein